MILFSLLSLFLLKLPLEKMEGAIKNGQSKETGNIGYTRRKTKTNKTQHQKLKKQHESQMVARFILSFRFKFINISNMHFNSI